MPRESKAERFARLVDRIGNPKYRIYTEAGGWIDKRRRTPEHTDLIDTVRALLQIERALQRISERQCSEAIDTTTAARLDKREARLEEKARKLAEYVSCTFYRQGDPRGCQVYLIRPGDIPAGQDVESYYSNGIAVCL